MAGIYIHIPFCKQACSYCDFHFVTATHERSAMVDAIQRELHLRKRELGATSIESIYFGGGTPSTLTDQQLTDILNTIYGQFSVAPNAEITLECNPDDLDRERLPLLRSLVNRLSIGTQSFDESDLKWMNRSHNAAQAKNSVEWAATAGFDSITIDLIYGLPQADLASWERNVTQALELPINHLSCYCLTIEPGTPLAYQVKKKRITPASEEAASSQFEHLQSWVTAAGFEQYEVSNFAQKGAYAKHNSAYWKRKPYLGIGPSAHSLIGSERSWNTANNKTYLLAINSGTRPHESETLTEVDVFNEMIMTGLRTAWGIDMNQLNQLVGKKRATQLLKAVSASPYSIQFEEVNHHLKLKPSALLLADKLAADLFQED